MAARRKILACIDKLGGKPVPADALIRQIWREPTEWDIKFQNDKEFGTPPDSPINQARPCWRSGTCR